MTSRATPVPTFLMVTVAPGTAPPRSSLISPDSVAPATCAFAGATEIAQNSNTTNALNLTAPHVLLPDVIITPPDGPSAEWPPSQTKIPVKPFLLAFP